VGLLIFLGVLAGIAIVFFVAYRMVAVRRTGRVIPMVRIGLAMDPTEAREWVARLRSAGIKCRVQGYGPSREDIFGEGPPGRTIGRMFGGAFSRGRWWVPNDYSIELWVRAQDEERARELLGMWE
jgi:hypothetical protein